MMSRDTDAATLRFFPGKEQQLKAASQLRLPAGLWRLAQEEV